MKNFSRREEEITGEVKHLTPEQKKQLLTEAIAHDLRMRNVQPQLSTKKIVPLTGKGRVTKLY